MFVGIVPGSSSDSGSSKDAFDLLVVHRDGTVRRLTSDLETEKWSKQPSGLDHGVAAAFLVDHDDARRALFRRRPDLAALAEGDVSMSAISVPPVLLLVSQPPSGAQAAKVHMFSVTTGATVGDFNGLQEIENVQLPKLDELQSDVKELQWTFHSGSAGLGLSFRQGYVNYDLSQYPPSCTSSLILADEDFSSIMRISPNSVIGAGRSLIALYDTHYSSIQRSITLRELSANKTLGKYDSKTVTKFVGYFAKLGIALAIKENTLQAFDLSSTHSIRGTSIKRQRDGLLIDAIGRGVNSPTAGVSDPAVLLGLKSTQEVQKWNAFKNEVEKASKAKDAKSFDNAVGNYFGPSVESQSLMAVHPEQLSFITSQIFTVRQYHSGDVRNTSSLEIAIWPEKTCKWLIKMGQLSVNHIHAAVRRANRTQVLPPFEPGSLVRALAEFDKSLGALTLLLTGPVTLDQEELAQALKIFLDEARARSMALDQSAEMTITGIPDGDENRQKVTPPSPTEASLEDAFIGLNLTLSRLHDYPTNQVVSCLRSTLSNTDTLAIVHHLRVSLATGGYTARFTEEPPVPLEAIKAAPPLSLEAIIDLMSASVDAIGPSGWISAVEFAGAAVNEAEMISHMQSEVSAALAGIEEAAYMKGIVGEFIRYGTRISNSSTATTTPAATAAITMGATEIDGEYTEITNSGTRARINREYDAYGKLWETYTFPKAGEEDGKILPLSLNTPDSDVSRTKIQKSTGEVKQRTKREIAYLQRQAVPDYSVVRIHL